ncbi:MAG TPA: hypothetical protein VK825_02315 [Xanthobacteraceae bacterium]|jgi:hypothetical protein|nr:hypothetical protein [Xanthobacteraceae bacterium]
MGIEKSSEDFSSDFWKDDFSVELSDVPGPVAVAKMTQTNAYEPHDPKRFHANAVAIADDFMALMRTLNQHSEA